MGGVFSRNISTWAEKILKEHREILTHGNSRKTRVLVLSTDPDKDNKVVETVLKKDPKTNKVTFRILPLADYYHKRWFWFLPFCDCCYFKDANKETEFKEKIKHDLKPTIILISPTHRELIKVLPQDKYLDKLLIPSEDYNIWSTLNMTISERVILTFSVKSIDTQVGEILKTKLKETKKTIPNDSNTRVLWISGSHGGQRQNTQGEYEPVGGKSGLTDEKMLVKTFYAKACAYMGMSGNFECWEPNMSEDQSKTLLSFDRDDIKDKPKIDNPKPSHSLLNDSELNKMTYRILNVADFHNTPDLRGDDPDTVRKRRKEFLEAVKRYNPTVIFIGWCYSSNGDVALALRGSPVLSLMLLKDDLRNISGVATAELDPDQIAIIQRLSEGDIRHCVFSGSSGTGKTYMCAEFGKILAAKLLCEVSGLKLEIVICSLWSIRGDSALLYQLWREKFFQGVEGFNVTYLEAGEMCAKYGVKYTEYVGENKEKEDIVELITAVCEKCDSDNCAKNDESRTIFLLDEAMVEIKDGVCDYSPLADLCSLKTVYTATCINPFQWSGGDEFTIKLPVACLLPCDKGHSNGCTFSSKLINCYRNSAKIRKLLRFYNDHLGGLLSHKGDKLGANLPPRLAGQHSAVTWVQCDSQENMEKAARDTVNKLEKDELEDVVFLYENEDVMASDVVSQVQGNYREEVYSDYYGLEANVCVYPTNDVIVPEVLSRPRRGLIVITGPDLDSDDQSFMKALAGDHHSETSRGNFKCLNKPCPWSCGHVSPVGHHVSLVAHTVSSPCGWTPLVEHKVISAACGHIMERTRDNCQQCGEKYLESGVFARTSVKQGLDYFIKSTMMITSVTDEELEDLLPISDIFNVTQQWSTALEGNDEELKSTLTKQLRNLITTNSPKIARIAVYEELIDFMENNTEVSVTEGEFQELLAISEIFNVTRELSRALEGNNEELQSTLTIKLKDLITTYVPRIAQWF